jgi:hypothetical protein
VVVGRVDELRVWVARGCKSRHGSSALWCRGTKAVERRRDCERGSKARNPGIEKISLARDGGSTRKR